MSTAAYHMDIYIDLNKPSIDKYCYDTTTQYRNAYNNRQSFLRENPNSFIIITQIVRGKTAKSDVRLEPINIVYGDKLPEEKKIDYTSTIDFIDQASKNINISNVCSITSYGEGAFGEVSADFFNANKVNKTFSERIDGHYELMKVREITKINPTVLKLYTLLDDNYNTQRIPDKISYRKCTPGHTIHAYIEQLYLFHMNSKDILSLEERQYNFKNDRWLLCKKVAKSVLNVLAELQKLNLKHCDIKPENLMYCGSTVRVIDFGLSKKTCRLGSMKFMPTRNSIRELIDSIKSWSPNDQYLIKNEPIPMCASTIDALEQLYDTLQNKYSTTINVLRELITNSDGKYSDIHALGVTLALVYPYGDDSRLQKFIVMLIKCEFDSIDNAFQYFTKHIEGQSGGKKRQLNNADKIEIRDFLQRKTKQELFVYLKRNASHVRYNATKSQMIEHIIHLKDNIRRH